MVAHSRVSSVLDNWVFDFGWICWESSLPPATSESNSFIQLSLKETFGGGRGDANTFSYTISPVSIMIAFGIQVGWECAVKNNCVRSCLTFLLSKLFFDPNTPCLDVFSTFCLYHARRGAFKSISYGSSCSLFKGFTAVKNIVCLSLPDFCPLGINPEFVMVQIDCTSDVTNVLEEFVRN